MKLSPPSYTRLAAIGLTLSATVAATLLAVAPAGASTLAVSAPGMAFNRLALTTSVDLPAPSATPTPTPSAAPTPSDAGTPSETAPPTETATAVSTETPSAAPVDPTPAPSTPAPTPVATPVTAPPAVAPPVAPPVTVPVTKPVTTPVRVKLPKPVSRPVPRPAPSGSSLSRAIAAIPGYSSGAPVRWVLTSSFGHLGMTDWYHNTIYLSPSIPRSELASVAKHEYGHILEARAYNGDIQAMIADVSRIFGGGGRGNLNGTELLADCIAAVNGASWTHYTGCGNATWRTAARRIIAGQRV